VRDSYDDAGPRCEKCGLEITTGAMAILCPHEKDCPLWVPAVEDFKRDWRDPATNSVVQSTEERHG
jgi:hypothetical protein